MNRDKLFSTVLLLYRFLSNWMISDLMPQDFKIAVAIYYFPTPGSLLGYHLEIILWEKRAWFFFFFDGVGFWTQGFTLLQSRHSQSRHLSNTSMDLKSILCWLLCRWGLLNCFPILEAFSAFQVVRVAVSHWHYTPPPPFFFFLNTGSCFVAQADLEFIVLLPQPPKGWNYRHMPRLVWYLNS
jgi:hypothetical protein